MKKKQKISCDICGIYKARVKDYRDIDGCVNKVLSCRWCAGLNDVAQYQIMSKKLDPVSFYDSIDIEKIDKEELQELSDKLRDKITCQLDDDEMLDKLLEYERELTLREEQPS